GEFARTLNGVPRWERGDGVSESAFHFVVHGSMCHRFHGGTARVDHAHRRSSGRRRWSGSSLAERRTDRKAFLLRFTQEEAVKRKTFRLIAVLATVRHGGRLASRFSARVTIR